MIIDDFLSNGVKRTDFRNEDNKKVLQRLLETELQKLNGPRKRRKLIELLNLRNLKIDEKLTREEALNLFKDLPNELKAFTPIFITRKSDVFVYRPNTADGYKGDHVMYLYERPEIRSLPFYAIGVKFFSFYSSDPKWNFKESEFRHQVYSGFNEMHYLDMVRFSDSEMISGSLYFNPARLEDAIPDITRSLKNFTKKIIENAVKKDKS